MAGVCTGLHDGTFWSADSGRVFTYGLSTNCQLGNGLTTGPNTTYEILTDVNGNQFYNVNNITPGWGPVSNLPFYAATKNNGGDTVWVWGNLTNLGGSSCAKPTPIIVSVGRTVASITAVNSSLHAVCTDGTVWVIGGTDDYSANTGVNATPTTFTQITIPNSTKIKYVVKGNSFIFYISTGGDTLYGNGEYGWLIKNQSTASFSPVNTPLFLNTFFTNGSLPIDTMVAAHTAYAILNKTNGFFTGGSNEPGLAGTGPSIIWPIYTTGGTTPYNGGVSAPWNWNVGMGQFVSQCTQVMKNSGITFTQLSGGGLYTFFFVAQGTQNGSFVILGTGRNKAAGLPAGIVFADSSGSHIGGTYHMGLNIVYWAYLTDPASLVTPIVASCPGCADGALTGTPCSFGTDAPSRPNTNLVPHLVVTPFAGGFTWSAATTTTDASHKILWPHSFITQTAGTVSDMGARAGQSGYVTGLAAGSYTIVDTIVDNSWDTVATSQTFTVPSATQTAFYFAASGGGTSCTIGSPCAPSYANTVFASAVGGDTLYFKRGDVFPVQLVANTSGVNGNPIVIRPYGTGKAPIIGGLTTASGFSSVGGLTNVWQTAYTGPFLNFAIWNNAQQTTARSPDLAIGYFIPSSMTINSITDAANASLVTTGTRIAIRSSAFTIDIATVTGVVGNVISFSPNATYTGAGGLGWMILNNTPTAANEWQDTLNQFRVYSVGSPTGTWQIPTVDTCVSIGGTYQEWDSIHIMGGNNVNVYVSGHSNNSGLTFVADTSDYGYDGFRMNGEGGMLFRYVVLNQLVDNGMLKQTNNNFNNLWFSPTVTNIGMIPGEGGTGNASQYYCGIVAGDSGSAVRYGRFTNIGYCGVTNFGSGFVVDSNFFTNFCFTLCDGAAVYTWMASPGSFAVSREINGNVGINGGGPMSLNGTTLTNLTSLIYLDNWTSQVSVGYNSGYNIQGPTYFDHGPSNTFIFNTSYGSPFADFYAQQNGSLVISGLNVNNNVFGSATTSIPAVRLATTGSNLPTFGTINNNQIVGAWGSSKPFWTFATGLSDPGTFRSPAGWTSNTGYDANSTYQVGYEYFYYNQSASGLPVTFLGYITDLSGGLHSGSVTIPSYNSQLFLLGSVPINFTKGSKIIVVP